MSEQEPTTSKASGQSTIREDGASYNASPRKRGRPRTLDNSVFDPLDVEPMALVRAVLRPPSDRRSEQADA